MARADGEVCGYLIKQRSKNATSGRMGGRRRVGVLLYE